MLHAMLTQSSATLASQSQQNQNPVLTPLFNDVQSSLQTLLKAGTTGYYVSDALAANSLVDLKLLAVAAPLIFRSSNRGIHYSTGDPQLKTISVYMTWLAQVDFACSN